MSCLAGFLMFRVDVSVLCIFFFFVAMVIRSHQVMQEGYEVSHDGKCITVFSAPNYW